MDFIYSVYGNIPVKATLLLESIHWWNVSMICKCWLNASRNRRFHQSQLCPYAYSVRSIYLHAPILSLIPCSSLTLWKIRRDSKEDSPKTKYAAKSLNKSSDSNDSISLGNEGSSASDTMSECLAKRYKKRVLLPNYINFEFILGSLAEVEHFNSLTKHVLKEKRRSVTPTLFVAIMLLKLNSILLDAQLVREEINANRLERAINRFNAPNIHAEQLLYTK